ncbi:hypothetical protein [Shouchella lonarensis]|uniref:Transglutaminase-like superfamily protein n=1 Tax=Shouchella lonarensis TaxID=1464122 RepID=A0A1G6H8T0_9BACI|nr:hypothetical protein [Shouchella lonarensis]SDB90662.1 hypothetical protein SAMN05421737_10371 [Shouchella lonarensis]
MSQRLPCFEIRLRGEISNTFLQLGVTNFHEAVTFVHQLPYGRNTDRTEYESVLTERKGTCSTKHALLSALCIEQAVEEVKLLTGIYEMEESNTPGVGQVLHAYGLQSIPEAHCYLKYRGKRFDFTRFHHAGEPIRTFLVEQEITPVQIGDFKLAFHRAVMAQWLNERELHRTFDVPRLWYIREQCIEALAESKT